MKSNLILHLFVADKFTKPLIPFLNEHFDPNNQVFLGLLNESKMEDFSKFSNCLFFKSPLRKHLLENIRLFYEYCNKADKIILHGSLLNHMFFLFPGFLEKCYWIIMGSELYTIEGRVSLDIQLRKFVLSRIKNHISHIKGDSELANTILHSNALFHFSPTYLSNTTSTEEFNPTNIEKRQKLNILVGNSYSNNNNHFQIFESIKNWNDDKINIYAPLSYGSDRDYRDKVINKGYEYFGNQFFPITDFMEFNSYKKFLNKIDIAIFNHNRQEALGVTLTLLSLGKIVYLNSNTTSFRSLLNRGFKIYDNELIITQGYRIKRDLDQNQQLLQQYYSVNSLIESYRSIYSS